MLRSIRLAIDSHDRQAAYAVRYDVFVTEQQVPADLELDELDELADHFVAYEDGEAVGAGRLVIEPAGFEGTDPGLGQVGHLGRLAVRPATRGTGLGAALVRAIEERATARGIRVVVLAAQTHATVFYERLGYLGDGEVFDDAGLPHRWMRRRLT